MDDSTGNHRWVGGNITPYPPPSRERIAFLIQLIAEAAVHQINQPRNVAKGDSWREMGWWEMGNRAFGHAHSSESREFMDRAAGAPSDDGFEDLIMEGGDILAFMAMIADKYGMEIEKWRPAYARLEDIRAAEERGEDPQPPVFVPREEGR